jgi:general secretion pathway protein M
MDQLKAWFNGLDEREQKITLAFSVLLAIFLLYVMLIGPINDSAASWNKKVISAQKDVNWMKKQVSLIRASKGGASISSSGMPLTSIVNTTTRKYDLPVSRRDSKSPQEMQVWFDNISFDSFLSWAAELKSKHGVTLSSVNVRSRDDDGITSINVKLIK